MNQSASHQKSSFNYKLAFYYIIIVFICINVCTGLVWIAGNISYIPKYGDTKEYLANSKTLIVDQYRGILYPYFLNRSNYLAEATGLKFQHVVYFFQILLTFLSIKLFAFVLFPETINVRIRWFIAFVTAAVVSLDPLVAHFSLTVMADSLAASFTIMYLAFLVLVIKEADAGARKTVLYFTMAICFFILISLTRVEKLYFGLIMFLLFLVIFAFRYNHVKSQKMLSLLFLVFCLFGVAIVNYVKSETQVNNSNRPSLDVPSIAFSRVMWPIMSQAYEYFPDNIKTIFTKAEANKFDEHANNVYPFLVKIMQRKDGREVILTITRTTIEHFPLQVTAKITFDFIKYTLPNVAFPLEFVGVLPISWATGWTVSRMGMYQPNLTKIYLMIGAVNFFAILIYVSQNLDFRHKKRVLKEVLISNPVIVIVSMAVIVNSMFFTLFHGMDAHIRYALPSYLIINTVLVSLLFGYMLPTVVEGLLVQVTALKLRLRNFLSR